MTTDTTASLTGPRGPAASGKDGGIRTSLRILAVGFSLLAVGWGSLTLASLLARATEHRSATYRGVRVLDVDLSFESIEIVGSANATSVTMTRSYTWSLGKPSISNRLDGDLLSIGSSCPFSVGLGCSGHVRLVVPTDLEVQVHDSDASMTLRDLDGPLDLSTSDGSIDVSNLTGRLRLHSNDGSMVATGLRSDEVEATTSDGSVRLKFALAPSSVTAGTGDGSIEVVVPPDGTAYDVTGTTGDGSRDVSVPLDSSSARHLKLSTGDGSVRVLAR
jgi:putative adhesin